MKRFFLALLALPALAAWTSGPHCAAQPPLSMVADLTRCQVSYRWQVANVTQHLLYRNGKLIGGYDHEEKHYLPWKDGKWGPAEAPPLTPPSPPAGFNEYMAKKLPTGVVPEKVSPIERFTIQGQVVPKEMVYEELATGEPAAGKLHDDSKKPTISVIGPDGAMRAKIVEQLKSSLGPAFKFWEGPPKDWSFEPGFVTDGNPLTIYVQSADGVVLHRQDDFDGGADKCVEAIRKAVPDYDAKKDPDARKPPDLLGGKFQLNAGVAVGVLASALAGFALWRQSRGPQA